jgi:hypothetical protein
MLMTTVMTATTSAIATELPNHVATGNEANTRRKLSRVSSRGHSRNAPLNSSDRLDSATTTIQ